MHKKSFASKVGAVVMAAAMTATMGLPAFAAAGMVYTPVAGDSVNVEKYLVMRNTANVPNMTFSYSIAPGAAQAASIANGNSQVYAGNDANKVVGAPTIGTAAFTAGQTTYTTAQTFAGDTQAASGKTDPVTLAANEKYARSDIEVDFSGVTFKEPGVYRYVISETPSTGDLSVEDDADLTRIMDVYVIDNAGDLEVQGYVLHDNEANAVVKADGSLTDGKADGFINRYVTEDLTLSKTVAGNQGSKDEYFEFTVHISDAVEGTIYTVDLSNADATTRTNAINTTAHTNPATLTVGSDGTVTQTFWLQHGQSIVVQGLAKETAYHTTETKATLDAEGYTASAAITGDTKDGTATNGNDMSMDTTTKVKDAHIEADTTVAYTNTKSGTIPTGVLMTIAPFAAVTILGGVGAATIAMKKKKEDEEEEA